MSQILNVHVRVNDADTNQPTPVRVHFSRPDGTFLPPLGRSEMFPTGRGEEVGGHLYVGGIKFATVDGSFEIPLPTGIPLRVEITKGPRYQPIRQTLTLGEGQLAVRFVLRKVIADEVTFADSRCHFLSPHLARLDAAAEGIDIANLLALTSDQPSQDGHQYRLHSNIAAFSGQTECLSGVVVNTFNTHPVLGRLALLNCHRAVYPLTFGGQEGTDDWSLGDWCNQCHRKKGLVVWCDAFREATLPGGESLVQAIFGQIDAIEWDAHERKKAFLPAIYQLWNAGILLPLVGGSARDDNRTPLGSLRTLTPNAPDYAAWVEFVRSGQSAITTGPVLRFSFDGATATGTAEAVSLEPFETLEIVANGKVIATAVPEDRDGLCRANVVWKGDAREDGWIAARCLSVGRETAKSTLYPNQTVFAHTSPVRIGPLVRQPAAVANLVADIEKTALWIERDGVFHNPKRRETLLQNCQAAIARLRETA